MRHVGYDESMSLEAWSRHVQRTKWYQDPDATWSEEGGWDRDDPPKPAVDEPCHDCGRRLTSAFKDHDLLDGRTVQLCTDCYRARCEAGQYLCTYCRCEFTKRALPERFCGDVMCDPCMRVTEKLLDDLGGTVSISYEPKSMN